MSFPIGTQVVVTSATVHSNGKILQPAGAVAVVVAVGDSATNDMTQVRFPDGLIWSVGNESIQQLDNYRRSVWQKGDTAAERMDLFQRVILRCVIGSQAYGLEDEKSDVDYRGVYLPRTQDLWSLTGVPEQLESEQMQEAYWELKKFLLLALKSNPNILECLHSPQVEFATTLGRELLELKGKFLSKLVYQTYNGYVLSQFKKMQADLRNQGKVKWKHVMHLLRLLLSGIQVLKTGEVMVEVGAYRDTLLAIKRQEWTLDQAEAWRKELHAEFDSAFAKSPLPDQPDYQAVNAFLLRARQAALSDDLP